MGPNWGPLTCDKQLPSEADPKDALTGTQDVKGGSRIAQA